MLHKYWCSSSVEPFIAVFFKELYQFFTLDGNFHHYHLEEFINIRGNQ